MKNAAYKSFHNDTGIAGDILRRLFNFNLTGYGDLYTNQAGMVNFDTLIKQATYIEQKWTEQDYKKWLTSRYDF